MEYLIPRGSTKYLFWTAVEDFNWFIGNLINNDYVRSKLIKDKDNSVRDFSRIHLKEKNSVTVPIPENTEYMKVSMPICRYDFYDKNMRLIHYPLEDVFNFNLYISGNRLFLVQVPESIRKIDFQTRMDILNDNYKIYPIPKCIDTNMIHYTNPIKLKKRKDW